MIRPKITAEDLVHSRSREEIQNKLQQIFGTYEDLERMDEGEIPLTIEGDVSYKYMADIERAAVDRDLPETEYLLGKAYDEIAKGYAKKVKKAQRTGETLREPELPHYETVARHLYWNTIAELKQMCRNRRLSDEGSKEDLIRRLKRS